MRKPLRIALIGWGAISRRVAELLASAQDARGIAIVAVGVRSSARAHDIPAGAELVTDPGQLAGLELDLVVEAAGREAVAIWGEAALRSAPAFAIASASALTDAALLERLLATAEANGSQLILPPARLPGSTPSRRHQRCRSTRSSTASSSRPRPGAARRRKRWSRSTN
ncbi:hypothetical protein [Bosea vestrisii]|uniref:hypothetical protein n=1 Tax=Bosea vestrisii TaxID=151416 RepID=UPI0032647D6A